MAEPPMAELPTDLHWMSATELASAIANKKTSSVEALDHFVTRIETLDGPINSVVQWDLERARSAAERADQAVTAGEPLGPLHGVPMTIKDSFQTEGCITTSGAPELADFVPDEDAWPVAGLRRAGAIPFAKTNLPIWAGDIQSFNDVYGTTNNPWDLDRTPGGSSGGSAAALAMGFTPIELGSDIGGSIRVPAHYSGVMGHKPSYAAVPAHGQIPGLPGTLTMADLAVAGPMARTAEDLRTSLLAMAGPDRWNAPGWTLQFPPSRCEQLADLRLAVWADDDYCPVGNATRTAIESVADQLRKSGAHVDDTARPDFTLEKAARVFRHLLSAAMSGGYPMSELDLLAADTRDTLAGEANRSTAMRHREWLSDNERRLQIRRKFEDFFTNYDAIIMPVQPRTAIPHDHSPDMHERLVDIDGVERSYIELFTWIAPAGLAYLPATVVPIGFDGDGLPIGVQIVGPYLHDMTTIRVGELIAEISDGCPRPALAE